MALLQVTRVLTVTLLLFYQGCVSQQPTCGMAVNNIRIVGGQESIPSSWPWQGAIFVFGDFRCGASLINDRWVMTAAHCLTANDLDYLEITLGAHNISDPGPNAVTLGAETIMCHPSYDPMTFDNDICLVKLSNEVNFTNSIQPICLPTEGSTFLTGTSTWVTGYGTTDSGSLSDVLQEVNVPVVGNNRCGCYLNDINEVTENMICAGSGMGGMDSCQGDSGGPMMTKRSTYWLQMGIVSWGYGCGFPRRPGVYTRVSQYEDWIEDNVDGSAVGFMTFTPSTVDPDSSFICPSTTVPPFTTHYYETTTVDDSIFDSGENLSHFTHFFSLCAVGLSLHVLVGAAAM